MNGSLAASLCALLACAGLSGCEKKNDPGKDMKAASSWTAPPPMASQPGAGGSAHGGGNPHAGMNMGGDPHAGMNMGGDPHAGMNMGGGDPHAGMNMGSDHAHGGMAGNPAMANMQPPDPDRKIDESKFLRGTITATGEAKGKVAKGAILFLAVRPIDELTGDILGSPIAVERIDIDSLPVPFELTGEHAMSAGTQFAGSVRIDARVDGDGDAISKEPGDVVGSVKAKIPAKGLRLSLDTVLR